jgi:molecular chaperone DnaK
MPVTPPLPPPDPEDESGEIMVDVGPPQQMKAEDFSGEMVIDRPPRDTDEEPVVAAPPAASRYGVVTSDGAGSAVASGEIKSAPTADPSAPSSVLLEVPDVAAEPVVALDFGTTRSSVAILVANQVQVLRLPTVAVMQLPGGEWDMPSCVGLREDGSVVLGQSAREMLATDPGNVVMSPKRLLGRRHDDREIQGLIAGSAVPTTSGPNGEVMLHLRGQESTVIQICAHVLTLLKLIAEKNLGRPVKKAVMSIPVTFMAEQREALKRAASLADLEIVSFIDEPVAAAVANLYDSHFRGKVAIYDLGGGTFDFAVVERISSGVQLLAKGGDPWLGGDDIDDALARAAANAFWHSTKIELHNKATEWQRLLVAAELAKRELSLQQMTVLRLPGVAQTAEGIHDLEFAINRSQFARLIREAIDRSLETCQQTLEVAGLRTSDIDAVFVSGGSTHIPAVQQALVEFFGKVPRAAVPPERAVLVGSALTHAFLSGAVKA